MFKKYCLCIECQKQKKRAYRPGASRFPMLNTWEPKTPTDSMGAMNPHMRKINN